MRIDVVDLRGFYASPLGNVARQVINRAIQSRWTNTSGLALLGLGYAVPYLDALKESTERTLAFMPAAQGVVHWPSVGLSASALVDGEEMPLRDSTIDRVLLVHALEVAEDPADMLSEIWRILAPGGRLLAIVPTRRGMWARSDMTPFGQGQPFSRTQLLALMREALFTPIHWGEALHVPPVQKRIFLRSAMAWERFGAVLSVPFASVHVIEATKQVYRPALNKKPARARMALRPVLAPGG